MGFVELYSKEALQWCDEGTFRTFLNLVSIGKAQEEKFGDDCKCLRSKIGTQVIEKECGYACDNDCDKNQDPDPENIINIDMHPIHWKDISPSQSLQVLEISPEEKLCKSQQCNEACRSLCFNHPHESTQTGENLNESDVTREMYGQNGEVIHTEVKQFIGQLCEEAFSNSSDLVNHENSHISKERAYYSQSGTIFKYSKCFEKHKVAVTGEKPYACSIVGRLHET
ncbi:hypothetical protein STEG23_016126 [Scotinomys teguina]